MKRLIAVFPLLAAGTGPDGAPAGELDYCVRSLCWSPRCCAGAEVGGRR